ncbi:MAG: tetratricopeptide repeat protein [Nitrospirae bacterium]|nr:tetratricopeptide repeat protein [Nitrospirota bacterium]
MSWKKFHRWSWLIPVLLALAFNLNVLQNGFGWDDETIIPHLKPPDRWRSLFLPDPDSPKQASAYYRPLVSVSYLLDYEFWGDRPFGFHLSVLLAHLLNTALVFFLARSLIRTTQPSRRGSSPDASPLTPHGLLPLLSASLFAVHPAHAEAVAWIAGRNDVFCTSFLLASLLLYLRFHRTDRRLFFTLSMLAFFFALLTKEIAVGLIVLFPLYEFLATEGGKPVPWKRLALRFAIPLAILGIYFWMRTANIIAPYGPGQPVNVSGGTWVEKILITYGLYLKLMAFPYPHSPFIATLPNSLSVLIVSGLILTAVAWGLFFAVIHRDRIVGMGLGWTVVFLIPAVAVAFQPLAAALAAERYVYAPSVGFVLVGAGVILKSLRLLQPDSKRARRQTAIGVALLLMAVISIGGRESWKRNTVWRSPVTFWEEAVASSPLAGLPYSELGIQYARSSRTAEAEALFKKSIILLEKTVGPMHPDLAKSLNNLAELYRTQNRETEAEPIHQRILAIRERTLGPNHPDVAKSLHNLALIYHAQKRYAAAEALYRRAISIWEKTPPADSSELAMSLNNLAALYSAEGRYAEAEAFFRRSLMTWEKAFGPDHPDSVTSLENYAVFLRQMNREAEATELEVRANRIKNKQARGD